MTLGVVTLGVVTLGQWVSTRAGRFLDRRRVHLLRAGRWRRGGRGAARLGLSWLLGATAQA
ncbi:MAG: hypothetical protein IV100_22390 [Myxococcales bacterium]|nr:hypothetical protein [Myxococcales bacterium]